jgi:hypothetical protein
MSWRPTSGSRGHLLGPLRGWRYLLEGFAYRPTSGVDIDVPKEATLCSEASPPPTRSVGLPPGLSGLGTEVAPPRSTIISLGPRGQTSTLSFGSTELT